MFEYKNFKMDVNFDDSDEYMYFKGIGSPYDGKPDLGNDIIQKGAYSRTLDQKGAIRPLLWQHKQEEPIGTVELEETDEGLMIKRGIIDKMISRGKDASRLIAMKAVKGLSIGYKAIKATTDSKGNRLLKEIALHEMSIVTFPMNEGAVITSAKAESVLDIDGHLMAIEQMISGEKSAPLTDEKINRLIDSLVLLRSKNADTNSRLTNFVKSSFDDELNKIKRVNKKELEELIKTKILNRR